MTEFTLPNAEQFDRLIDVIGKGNKTRPPDDVHGAPGPKYIEKGDKQAGFYGFVKPGEFGTIDDNEEPNNVFSVENLAMAVGITQGVAVYQDTPWLKFSWKGKILLVPMRTIRRSITYDHIYLAGAVFGTGNDISEGEQFILDNDVRFTSNHERTPQDSIVTIDGLRYRVRLMRGSGNPVNEYGSAGRGGPGPDNEWNRLVLPLHERAPSSFNYNSHAGAPTEDWGTNLTDNDLKTHHTLGVGNYSWMQEPTDHIAESDDAALGTIRRVYRGYHGASHLVAASSTAVSTINGWRPVLELI